MTKVSANKERVNEHLCKILYKGPVKQIFERKIATFFLSISLNMCFGCSQHMFWLRNKKKSVMHSYLGTSGFAQTWKSPRI